ncbi:hypothetical protein ACP70R_042376 [Stipagrostis hirtigluma subsp. patula]
MMSRLSLLCLLLLSITCLPPQSEGCQDCSTIEERNDEMFQSENSVYMSPSLKQDVTSSSKGKRKSGDMHHKLVPEHNGTSSIHALIRHNNSSVDANDDLVVYFAAHSSFPGKPYKEYYGLAATVDVYGYKLSRGQMSTFTIWVANMGGGSMDNYNSIHVGWMVAPEIYGDSETHFYTHWTRWTWEDWVLQHGLPWFLIGKGIKNSSRCYYTSCFWSGGISRDYYNQSARSSGNWWVYYGLNNNTPTAVGYYPANIFTGLADKADEIAVGGESSATRSLSTPPMGYGSLPSENAASISNIQFIDQDGQSIPITSDLPIIAQKPKCYYVSPIVDAKFFFGGPAGCF